MDSEYTFPSIELDPGESRRVPLDLFPKAAVFWEPNELYSAGEFVWPRSPSGLVFEKTSAGQQRSGSREPAWARVAGEPVPDGPLTWTARDSPLSGISTVSGVTATSEPPGLAVDDVIVSEVCKILATYTPPATSVDGQEFDAVFSFTLNGVARIARQTVKVRKQ